LLEAQREPIAEGNSRRYEVAAFDVDRSMKHSGLGDAGVISEKITTLFF